MEDLAAKYSNFGNNKLGGRIFTYVQLMLLFTIMFIAFRNSNIVISSKVVYIIQISTTAILFVLGIISLVRATTRHESAFFLSGVIYTLAGISLGIGTLLFAEAFNQIFPVLTDIIPHWYLTLPVNFIILSAIVRGIFELRDDRLNKNVPLSNRRILIVSLITYGVLHFVMFRYANIIPDVNQFTQLALIILALISLAVNLFTGRWRTDIYHHWIIVAMVCFLGAGLLLITGGELTQIQTVLGWIVILNGVMAVLLGQLFSIFELLKKGELQKELAVKQAKSLEVFNLATDSVSDMIVISDSEGIVLYANPSVKRITGYTISEAMGSKAGTLWGRQMSKAFYRNLWDTIKTNKQTYRGEIINLRKNGSQYNAELSISPILDRDGEIQYFVAVERDITIEKNFEKRKYDFLSVISHRLRTPLTTNKWTLEMLNSGEAGKLTKKQKSYLEDMDESNERLINLVNLMTRITDLETGKAELSPVQISLRDLTEEILLNYEGPIKDKGLEFKIPSKGTKIPTVKLDRELTTQIINIVISNAIKFSKKNGKINVRCDYREGFVVLQVEDYGYGIPNEEQESVFKGFYRGGNIGEVDTQGSGLSLYLARLLIESFGGRIWFESKENKGTKVYIAFPLISKSVTNEIVDVDPKALELTESKTEK